jgi:hypothetical protein
MASEQLVSTVVATCQIHMFFLLLLGPVVPLALVLVLILLLLLLFLALVLLPLVAVLLLLLILLLLLLILLVLVLSSLALLGRLGSHHHFYAICDDFSS